MPGVPESEPTRETGTCISFDFGIRRIGMAVGEGRLQSASPVGIALNHNGTPDWRAIDAVINQWQPTDLIVGWPLTEAGEQQEITHHVKGFIKRLVQRYDLPVHKVDERFSSVAAQQELQQLRASGQRKRKTSHADVDTLAAALILESWFSMRKPT